MSTDVSIGDQEVAALNVTPADGTTVATLTVTAPDGTITTPAVTGSAVDPDTGTQTWTSDPVTYSQVGLWVLHWTVTGTGAGVEDLERYVVASPVAGGWPAWAPALTDVAIHIPYLTVDTITPGSATYQGTFTATTSPTTAQADRHVVAAVISVAAAITSTTGTLAEALHGLARIVAALRAAAAILRAFPRDPSDPNERAIAADLDRRADTELARLIAANDALNEDDGTYGIDIAPIWSYWDSSTCL